MDPALLTGLFGLGGVLVGGGVTAWSERESENRRTINEGVAAARLVHLELIGLKARLIDAMEGDGEWRWIPEPPLTPVLDREMGALAPLLTYAEWAAVASLAAQCRFTEPLLAESRSLAFRKFHELPEDHPESETCGHMDVEEKEIVTRILDRIDPVMDAIGSLISGQRATRTQRVLRWLKLTPRTLGG